MGDCSVLGGWNGTRLVSSLSLLTSTANFSGPNVALLHIAIPIIYA